MGGARWTLNRLAAALSGIAVLAALVGIVLVANSTSESSGREIGRWSLQLALVFAGTGVVSALLRQSDLSRTRREAWTESLHQLIAAHDDVQMAGRLLSTHATAKTYAEQMKVITAVRGVLRRLASGPDVNDEPALREALYTMRTYLKRLVLEYRERYLPVARQQLLDEAVLANRIKHAADAAGNAFSDLPPELGMPMPAGLALQDPARFPHLIAFQQDFKSSDFRTAYRTAKSIMQRRAGIPGPSAPDA